MIRLINEIIVLQTLRGEHLSRCIGRLAGKVVAHAHPNLPHVYLEHSGHL